MRDDPQPKRCHVLALIGGASGSVTVFALNSLNYPSSPMEGEFGGFNAAAMLGLGILGLALGWLSDRLPWCGISMPVLGLPALLISVHLFQPIHPEYGIDTLFLGVIGGGMAMVPMLIASKYLPRKDSTD